MVYSTKENLVGSAKTKIKWKSRVAEQVVGVPDKYNGLMAGDWFFFNGLQLRVKVKDCGVIFLDDGTNETKIAIISRNNFPEWKFCYSTLNYPPTLIKLLTRKIKSDLMRLDIYREILEYRSKEKNRKYRQKQKKLLSI